MFGIDEKYDEHSETPRCLGKTKFHIGPGNTDGKKVEGPDRLGQSRLGGRDCNESGWKGSKEELERRKQGDWLKRDWARSQSQKSMTYVCGQARAIGLRRPIQCIVWPCVSMRGSIPKCIRSEFLQLNLLGRSRFFWRTSKNKARDVLLFNLGASKPK